jgi:hypothetical protein
MATDGVTAAVEKMTARKTAANEGTDRLVEPAVTVRMSHAVDKRVQVQERFNAEFPEYVHVWESKDTPVEELELNGRQHVRWEGKGVSEALKGKLVSVRSDVLCRQRREDFEEPRKEGEETSRQLVDQSMRGRDAGEDMKWQPRNLVRKPKDARDIGKPVN